MLMAQCGKLREPQPLVMMQGRPKSGAAARAKARLARMAEREGVEEKSEPTSAAAELTASAKASRSGLVPGKRLTAAQRCDVDASDAPPPPIPTLSNWSPVAAGTHKVNGQTSMRWPARC